MLNYSLGQEVQNKEDLRSFDPDLQIPRNKLPEILVNKSLDERDLTIEQIKDLFVENKKVLYGGYREVSKFATLEALCDLAVKNKDATQLSSFLRNEIKKLDLSKETTKFWPENSVESRGGTLGLLIETEVRISKIEGYKYLYSQAMTEGDLECLRVLLPKIFVLTETLENREIYINFLRITEAEKSTSTEVKQMITNILKREGERVQNLK